METIKCKKCGSLLPVKFAFCPSCGRATGDLPKSNRRRPKGSGSVFKLSGKRSQPWAAKLDGKMIGYFSDRSAAEVYLAGKLCAKPEMLALSVQKIYDRYTSSTAYNRLTEGSKKNVQTAWKRFDSVQNKKMRDMKTTDFQNLINAANEDGCGRDGCSKIKSLASALCQNAMLDDIITRDYSDGVELPEHILYVKRRNFTQEEILNLLYHDTDRDARIVLTMIYTALRLGELFDIEKENVHLEEWYMVGGGKTDAGTDRIVPIKEEIQPYIIEFMQESGKYLISTVTGKKMHESNFRNRGFYPLLDRLGFDYKDENGHNVLTPHRSRHTYISESIAAGVKPEVLRLVVGHARYATSVSKYGNETRLEVLHKEVKKSF